MAVFVGCRPEKPIEVQTYDKLEELMLVGVTLREGTLWSIKLVNSRERVLAIEDSVYEFAKSFEFQSDPQEDPKWMVPANWVKLDLTMPFRKATFEIQDADEKSDRTQVIVSEIRMGQTMNAEDSIVANINRWRKEMNAEEIINYTVNEKGTPVERSAASLVIPFMKKIMIDGRPMYFDKIEGVYQKRSGPARQMPGMMGKGHSGGFGKTSGSPAKSGTSEPDKPFEYEKPEAWKQIAGGSISILKFNAGEGDDKVQISVSKFPAQADSVNWQSTVAMWQGQLKVERTEEKELDKVTQKIPVGEFDGKLIKIAGQKEQDGVALVGVMLESTSSEKIADKDKAKWFIKMQGPQKTVDSERANFEAFVKSIRFEPVNNDKQTNENKK